MRAPSTRWIPLLLLLGASASAAGPAPGRMRLELRNGLAEDPGVLRISGRGAESIVSVLFGETPSAVVAPGKYPGVTVLVPPGEPATRVPVRVALADGRRRILGRFRYDDPVFQGRRRTAAIGGGTGCLESAEPGAPSHGGSTISRVRRLGDGTFLYRWEVESTYTENVLLRWPALGYLGFEGGVVLDLAPGQAMAFTQASASPPVQIGGIAGVDGVPGCTGWDPENPGASWYGPAFLPADLLPAVAPPAGLRFVTDGEGITWLHWDVEEATLQFVRVSGRYWGDYPGYRNDVQVAYEWDLEPHRSPFPLTGGKGVTSWVVRAVRDGVPGEPIRAHGVK